VVPPERKKHFLNAEIVLPLQQDNQAAGARGGREGGRLQSRPEPEGELAHQRRFAPLDRGGNYRGGGLNSKG